MNFDHILKKTIRREPMTNTGEKLGTCPTCGSNNRGIRLWIEKRDQRCTDLWHNDRFCGRCGHSANWHRLDDSTNVSPTDPKAQFRCLGYDCERPGPVPRGGRACDCPDFVGDRPLYRPIKPVEVNRD